MLSITKFRQTQNGIRQKRDNVVAAVVKVVSLNQIGKIAFNECMFLNRQNVKGYATLH